MRFADVAGLQKIKDQLSAGVKNNKLSHSLLFVENNGNGGLPLALAFAQFLLCDSTVEGDACGTCPSCIKMGKLVHPDVHFTYPTVSTGASKPPISVDFINNWRSIVLDNPYFSYVDWMKHLNAENKQGNITIAECHEIIKHLGLKAFEGGKKIQIIWLPEFLGKNGNSLLKIIEEPTDNTFFIMVTQNQEQILNTILSRSQIYLLPPLQKEDIRQFLSHKFPDNTTDTEKVAGLVEGNLTDAISKISHEVVNYSETLSQWLSLCVRADVEGIYHWVNQFVKNGRETQKDFLQNAIGIIRKVLHYKTVSNHQPGADEQERNCVELLSRLSVEEKLPEIYRLFNDAHYHISRNANQKIIFFELSLQVNLMFS